MKENNQLKNTPQHLIVGVFFYVINPWLYRLLEDFKDITEVLQVPGTCNTSVIKLNCDISAIKKLNGVQFLVLIYPLKLYNYKIVLIFRIDEGGIRWRLRF